MLAWVQWLMMSEDEAGVSEILLACSSQPQGGCSSSRHHILTAFRVKEKGSTRKGFSFPSCQGEEYHSRRAFHLPGQVLGGGRGRLGRKCLNRLKTWRVAGREWEATVPHQVQYFQTSLSLVLIKPMPTFPVS